MSDAPTNVTALPVRPANRSKDQATRLIANGIVRVILGTIRLIQQRNNRDQTYHQATQEVIDGLADSARGILELTTDAHGPKLRAAVRTGDTSRAGRKSSTTAGRPARRNPPGDTIGS